MTVAAPGEPSPWQRARERALELHGAGGRILLFGEGVEVLQPDSLELLGPRASMSRLAPALERAAEFGAPSVVVLSDMRLQDRAAVEERVANLTIPVRFERFAAAVRNAGISEFRVPETAEAEDSLAAEIVVFAEGAAGEDSIPVEVRDGEARVLGSRRVSAPPLGGLARIRMMLPPPRDRGAVRYEVVASLPGDAYAADNRRIGVTMVDPQEGGVVLVSLEPDWEPRFLLPVLEGVTGLEARGFLSLGAAGFLPMRSGAESGSPIEAPALEPRVERADLLVVHGLTGEVPEWLASALEGSRRALVFARDGAGANLAGPSAGPPRSGEWYVSPSLPVSPVAADLAGVAFRDLPPLGDLLEVARAQEQVGTLRVQLQGRGPELPALILVAEDSRRKAVALATGFWRWAFRPGPPRAAYRRLWSAVVGWLFGNEPFAAGSGVRPTRLVVPRGQAISWIASGLEEDTLSLELIRDSTVRLDQAVRVSRDGTFRIPRLPPGEYQYRARDDSGTDVGRGALDVESYSEELLTPPSEPPSFQGGSAGTEGGARAPGRPLRTHPLPYLLIICLLSIEWILRRRQGLR
jgi:hypothetical protein